MRFQNLRHCHASKLDELGFSVPEIAGQLGHTQIQTTLRYTNRHKEGIQKVAFALDSVYQNSIPKTDESEFVN